MPGTRIDSYQVNDLKVTTTLNDNSIEVIIKDQSVGSYQISKAAKFNNWAEGVVAQNEQLIRDTASRKNQISINCIERNGWMKTTKGEKPTPQSVVFENYPAPSVYAKSREAGVEVRNIHFDFIIQNIDTDFRLLIDRWF